MRGKIIFVVGLATGYVLGTRAGRERYEQIKAGAEKVWNTPTVQSGVETVQSFAGDRVEAVKAEISVKLRSALGALIGREPLKGPQQSSAATKAGSTRATPATTSASGTSGAAGTSGARTSGAKAPAKAPAKKAAATKPATRTSTAAKPAAAPESDD